MHYRWLRVWDCVSEQVSKSSEWILVKVDQLPKLEILASGRNYWKYDISDQYCIEWQSKMKENEECVDLEKTLNAIRNVEFSSVLK